MKVSLTFNGQSTTWETVPGEVLLETLRRLGWYGAKRGCNTGDCGACTVRIDGDAVNACQIFTVALDGHALQTIEGLSHQDAATGSLKLHPIQEHFVEAAAVQCGYCIPGMVMSTAALLESNPAPSDSEIRRALDGNLCRCTGYVKIFDAVHAAAKELCGASQPAKPAQPGKSANKKEAVR